MPGWTRGAAWRWPARALSQRIDTCCAHAPTAAGTADDWPPSPSASPSSGAAPYPLATTVGIREGKNDVEVTVLLGTALTESLAKALLARWSRFSRQADVEALGQLAAPGDAELHVGALEVVVHRAHRDEEALAISLLVRSGRPAWPPRARGLRALRCSRVR